MPLTLQRLTEQLSAAIRSSLREAATEAGLKLVQLEALGYLAAANRYSDTPAALTEYLGVTKGTVSQTLKTLEGRGLIHKTTDPVDRRVQRCRPSPEGLALVRRSFPAEVFRNLDADVVESATTEVEHLVRALQHANGLRTFGRCQTCRMFEPRARGGRCGLTGESLSQSDKTKLCREHEVPES